MNKTCFLVSVLLLSSYVGLARCQQASPNVNSTFVIDTSKPYVYLAIDHIGPRKPLRDGEIGLGIWLRLKNNSQIPIVVIASALDVQKTNQATWVDDEVIPNVSPAGAVSVGSGIGSRKGEENFIDIFLTPNNHEAEIRSAEALSKVTNNGPMIIRPHGYIDRNAPSSAVLKVIPSGGEVLFSVPANHVGKSWHLEVPFRFAIEPHINLRQPYSYVALLWGDLTEADRSLILKAAEIEPAKTGSTPSHEVKQDPSSPR